MKHLIERGEQAAAEAADRALGRAAEAARAMLPEDVSIETAGGELRLSGRRLSVRWIADARLRSLGLWLREALK